MITFKHPALPRMATFLVFCTSLVACSGSSNNPETVPEPQLQPLAITATTPADGGTGVLNTVTVSATFDQPVNPATLGGGNFSVRCPSDAQPFGSVAYDAATRTATFIGVSSTPTNEAQSQIAEPLLANTTCVATISTGVRAVSGAALARNVVWSFSTVPDAAFLEQGKNTFRFETFGDESQWSDALRMHEVIGTAVDPTTALSVGLKVDSEALPAEVVSGIVDGSISLTSPDTTVALIKLNAVVGVKGTVEQRGGRDVLTRVGITCALCHSTVDNSFAPGIGKRLDGWPNRDLNPGAIIALSPALNPQQKAVYNSWGPGKYDPRFNLDGMNGPQVISPAFGLQGIHKITATGDGDNLAYWNRYVGVTQMGGHGNFTDGRLGSTGVSVTNGNDDQVSARLAALQAYQLSIPAPAAPIGSFDGAAAERGRVLFKGVAGCASCHSGPEFTDANERLHDPTEVASEPEAQGVPSYASRTATGKYRSAPLKGVWQHPPYFHNGSAATLEDVVRMYNTKNSLDLTETEIADLAQYLKSL